VCGKALPFRKALQILGGSAAQDAAEPQLILKPDGKAELFRTPSG
jgi:hypothetical protein